MNDDYEEAASILDEIITSSFPGDTLAAFAQQALPALAHLRSTSHCTPEYSEEALYRVHAFRGSSSVQERVDVLGPEFIAISRIQNFGSKEDLWQNFLSLQTQMADGKFALVPGSDYIDFNRKAGSLLGLLFRFCNDDITNINEAVEEARVIVASCAPPTCQITSGPSTEGQVIFGSCAPPTFQLTSWSSMALAQILGLAFIRTNNFEYLSESISMHRRLVELPLLPLIRVDILQGLANCLIFRAQIRSRFPLDQRMKDLQEALELLSQCADSKHASFPDRCRLACQWACLARVIRHPSVSTAYESALSLMQDSLYFAPTLQLQHTTLTKYSGFNDILRMSLDYASYQVDLHQLEEAIVTLERGRALLWSEMRHLRTSIDQIRQADPQVGQKFAAVNRDLEYLTKSIPPNHKLTMDSGPADDVRAVDLFGRLLVKQRQLLKERFDLVSQIQALPGFDNFLASPSFDTLHSAASHGPVIIINHSCWRSDILILLHESPLSLIPTPDGFYDRASALKNELLGARNKHGPDSDNYNQTLAHVLTELYVLVGKPVIDRLRQLDVPEQSRVWWCPTSVFCSLPLHAMGPIPSDGGEDRYFLDIYIPSYTPTLSALIPASDHRDPGPSPSGLPSLLLVAHFDVPSLDVSLSEVCEDVKVVQALKKRIPVKSLISDDATPTSVLDDLRAHQFVHFVCHGTLETRKPFDAGFELHGNERLTLLNIVRSHLPTAEFAFLSACHTAELTEGSAADEGLHLAAAVQYCGFRSVVGTMWAMANQDGPDVAKYFYQSMFPKKEKG